MRRKFIGTMIFLLAVPFLGAGFQERAQPSQRLDPKIQKSSRDLADRIAEIEKKLESFGTRNTMSDPTQPDRESAGSAVDLDHSKASAPRLQGALTRHTIRRPGGLERDRAAQRRSDVAGKMPAGGKPQDHDHRHYDSLNLRGAARNCETIPQKPLRLLAPRSDRRRQRHGLRDGMRAGMSQYEFDATLVFVAFAARSRPHRARAMAKRLKENSQTIQAVLNNDIIGSEVSGNGVIDNRRSESFVGRPERTAFETDSRTYVKRNRRTDTFPEMIGRTDLPLRSLRRAAIHTAFNNEGFAGSANNHATRTSANPALPLPDTLPTHRRLMQRKVTRIHAATAASMAAFAAIPDSRGELSTPPGAARGLRLTRQTPKAVPTPRRASNWSGTHKGRLAMTRCCDGIIRKPTRILRDSSSWCVLRHGPIW